MYPIKNLANIRRSIVIGLAVIIFSAGAAQAESLKSIEGLESLTYVYAGGSSIYQNSMAKTKNCITTICPDYFEINPITGGLKTTPRLDRSFIENMHLKGVRVTPYLSNHWDMDLGRLALANRTILAGQLADMVKDYEMDGVDIDIENINHNDRESFTDFIKILRTKLPAGKSLTVCVAANPWGSTTDWQGAYDYTALAGYTDHIFVMAYDESYNGGPAGPVASLSFVEKSVKYAVSKAPAEKIVIGVPYYGRYWKYGAVTGGQALTMNSIEGLNEAYGAEVWYDTKNECARARLTIGEITPPMWGGKKLDPGVYDIWYENDLSLMKKMALVRKYGLRGVGSWALGQEAPRIWNYYSAWLNGYSFNDIYGHWSSGYVENLYELGIVKGTPSKNFFPNNNITRAEALALISRAADMPIVAAPEVFVDIKGHWAEDIICAGAYYNLAKGDGNGNFRPNDPMNRQEFSVMLMRIMNLSPALDYTQELYTDVSPALTPWSNDAIISLAVHGILSTGAEPIVFRPNDNITRGEAAKMISMAMELPRKLPEPGIGESRIIIEPS